MLAHLYCTTEMRIYVCTDREETSVTVDSLAGGIWSVPVLKEILYFTTLKTCCVRKKPLCTGYRRILTFCVCVWKGRSTLMWVRITEVITSITEVNNEFFDHQHHHLCTD